MSKKNSSLNNVKMKEAEKYIEAAKALSKTVGGGVISAKLVGVYTKLAQIIASALLNLGLNTCAYIISKFPAKLREPVINMLKKEVQLYEEKEKFFADKEKEKEKFFAEKEKENQKIYEENQKVFNAVIGGGKACSSLKKDDCAKNKDDCLWINSKCVGKQEIDSWNQAKLYTLQLVPEMNLNDFKYTEGIDGKAFIGLSIKAIRWGLICTFVYFFHNQTLLIGGTMFVGANLAYDFAAFIAHRIMYPNYKKQKGIMAHIDVAADNAANYLKSTEAPPMQAYVLQPSLEPSDALPSTKKSSTKKSSTKRASSAKASSAKASSAKASSTKRVSFAKNRRTKSRKMTPR